MSAYEYLSLLITQGIMAAILLIRIEKLADDLKKAIAEAWGECEKEQKGNLPAPTAGQ